MDELAVERREGEEERRRLDRRRSMKSLTREMRVRAEFWSAAETLAVIQVLQQALAQSAPASRGNGTGSTDTDHPEPSGAVQAGGCPPWEGVPV